MRQGGRGLSAVENRDILRVEEDPLAYGHVADPQVRFYLPLCSFDFPLISL
jgi:hypothetical protein